MDYQGVLELRPLDHRGRVFAEGRLEDGKSLAHLLLDRNLLATGSIAALVSPGLDDVQLYEFDGSVVPQLPREQWVKIPGGLAQEVVNTTSWLEMAIQTRLQTISNGLVVVQDYNSSPSDGWLSRSEHRPWVKSEEVYFAADGTSRERLSSAIDRGTGPWPGLLAVVCAPEGATSHTWGDRLLTDAHLAQFADSVSEMWIGAYDGESYLLWCANESTALEYRKLLDFGRVV